MLNPVEIEFHDWQAGASASLLVTMPDLNDLAG